MKDSIRPLIKILSGAGAAQIIALLLLPISSRLYSPEDFGVFGMSLAISALATTVATLQLQNALVLPKVESHAVGLFFLSCGGSLIGGALVAFGLGAVQWHTQTLFGSDSFLLPILIGFLVFASGIAQAFQSLSVRRKAFGAIGYVAIVRILVVSVLQLGLGVAGMGFDGLLWAQVFGEVSAAWCFFSLNRLSPDVLIFPKLIKMKALLSRYRDFLIYGVAQESMVAASQGVPIWLLGHYFGGGVSGSYAFATRVLMAPCVLVGNAIRQVFSRRFAEQARIPGRLAHDFFAVTAALLGFFVPISFFISPFFTDLFVWLFGEPWKTAGDYSKWLFLWMVMGICNAPATIVFRTMNRQRESFVYNVILLFLRFLSLVVCGLYVSDQWAVAVFSVLGVAMYFVFIFMAYFYASRSANLEGVNRSI